MMPFCSCEKCHKTYGGEYVPKNGKCEVCGEPMKIGQINFEDKHGIFKRPTKKPELIFFFFIDIYTYSKEVDKEEILASKISEFTLRHGKYPDEIHILRPDSWFIESFKPTLFMGIPVRII